MHYFIFLLVINDPKAPPRATAKINGKVNDIFNLKVFEAMSPLKPAIELHKIKREASAATVRASFHPIKLSVGERKIPPPMPETPDSNPIPLPIINFLLAFKGLLEWDR